MDQLTNLPKLTQTFCARVYKLKHAQDRIVPDAIVPSIRHS